MSKTALCSKCGERKNVRMFGKNKSRSTGLQAYCKPCRRAYDKSRLSVTKRYGITRDELLKMLNRQDHKCAICRVSATAAPKVGTYRSWIGLVVDHNHRTGRVRGLLCQHCNLGIGKLQDDLAIVQRAAQYLSQDIV